MTISSIQTSKGEVRYAQCCSGPQNIIMLPGVSVTSVMGSAAVVEAAYGAFKDQYTIYLFEYPRDYYPEGADIRYLADWLAEAIDLLKLTDCYLFGASFGGMLGQILLAEHPEVFVSAVLSSAVARISEASPETIRRWYEIASNGDVRTLNLAFFDAVYSDEYQLKFARAIRKILNIGSENDCRVMAVHCGMMLQADLREYDQKIKTPTLVIGSKQDHVFSIEDIEDVAHFIGCKMEVYEGYSHAVFDEASDFKERILAYFETSDTSGIK